MEKNDYQKQIVDNKIGKFKTQRQLKNTTTLKTNKDKSKFHKFTYHQFFMHKFQRIFNKFKISLAPKDNFTLEKLINYKFKDKTVYRINQAFTKSSLRITKDVLLDKLVKI